MKLGITAVVIGTLLFVGLADEMKVTSDDIAAYISNNQISEVVRLNKTLATYMSVAISAIIVCSLLIGIVYQSLFDKNIEHQDHLKDKYQLQTK